MAGAAVGQAETHQRVSIRAAALGNVVLLLTLWTSSVQPSAAWNWKLLEQPALQTKVPPKGPRPRIYLYENLNPRWRKSREAWDWQYTALYGLEMTFPLVLKDSPYITKDPEEADFFYVWAWPYYNEDFMLLSEVIADLRALGPWWDRNQGRDHIWTVTHDQGVCDRDDFRNHLRNSIVLEHWGKPTGVYSDNPCHIMEYWPGDKCDLVFNIVERQHAAHGIGHHHEHENEHGHSSALAGRRRPMPWPCYLQGKDLVVPTVTSEDPSTSWYIAPENFTSLQKENLLLFGGGINVTHLTDPEKPWQDAGYSFGTRQTLARLYEHYPGIKIFAKMVPNYWEEVHKSIFCFGPAGWGWGARVKSAITRGCIPVIVMDGIKAEWEDELPYFHFAIRLPSMYLHRLPEILQKYIEGGRVPTMQKNLQCVWRLFWWTRPHGRAFEMTMCALKARLLKGKVRVDFNDCRLYCGDDVPVDFNATVNSV